MMRVILIGAIAIAAVAITSGSADAQGHGGRIAAARAGAGNGNVNGIGSRAAWISHSTWGDYWADQQAQQKPWHSGRASNGGGGGVFKATPHWPSHTDQFGVYPVRGPW